MVFSDREIVRPRLVFAEKETPAPQPKASGLSLDEHISAVLNHPDTPASITLWAMRCATSKKDGCHRQRGVCQAVICKHLEKEGSRRMRARHMSSHIPVAVDQVWLPREALPEKRFPQPLAAGLRPAFQK
jgi:hypothetical protein